MKNRIINGAMVIDQRNAGASVATSTLTQNVYDVDRWFYYVSPVSKFTMQQNAGSVTPPAGFVNYLGMTSTSAYSVGSTDQLVIGQAIEGFNIADLGWGTANAKTVTLSFQVYSSLTGTFGGALRNSSVARSYPFTFTVSSANTWTSISVTIAGDTSGTWLTTNGAGIFLTFNMGMGSSFNGTANAWQAGNIQGVSGSVNMVGTSGATFYITGVQLEVGSSATGFDYRQYQQELALCQRYYFPFTGGASGFANGSTVAEVATIFPVTMRAAPTLGAGISLQTVNWTGGSVNPSSISVGTLYAGLTGASWRFNNYTGFTLGQGLVCQGSGVTATFSAEL
jgi:hypothetical protein